MEALTKAVTQVKKLLELDAQTDVLPATHKAWVLQIQNNLVKRLAQAQLEAFKEGLTK